MDGITRREVQIFLTVFFLLGMFVQWYGVNANARFDLTRSIVDHQTLTINEVYQNTGDRSYYNGEYYSDKEPGMAFLALPVYAGWKGVYGLFGNATVDTGDRRTMLEANNVTVMYPADPGPFYLSALILVILLTSTLALSILTVLIYRLSEEFLERESTRLLVTFGFAFGTLLTHYGTLFMPNAVVTLLSFSSFYLVYRAKVLHRRRALLAGGLGGFAVVVDPTAAPVVLGVGLYAIMTFGRVPYAYIAGGIVGILPMAGYNTALFGYPWMLPRFFLDPALYPQLQQASSVIPDLAEQGFRMDPVRLFFVVIRLLFYPHRGIFYWFPFLLLALLGFRRFAAWNRRIAITTTAAFVLLVVMIAGWWAWWMGGFFGARYLSVIVPFLMFPLFYAVRTVDNRVLTLLVAASIAVNVAGFTGSYEDKLKDLENSSEMKDRYRERVTTFQPLANPVVTFYFDRLMETGPQSQIVNGLYRGDFPPDIRTYAGAKQDYGPHGPPTAPTSLLIGIIALVAVGVWHRELSETTVERTKRLHDILQGSSEGGTD